MDNLQFPRWEKPLREALSECDLRKLVEKVHETEAAMFIRWQELAATADGHLELAAMRRAADALLRIKTEKLKWPGGDVQGSNGS
jgi:hypothetical protein